MKVATRARNTSLYMTWYDFKKELEKRSGHSVLNQDWLKVKPRTHLPWTATNMQSSLVKLMRIDRRKRAAKLVPR